MKKNELSQMVKSFKITCSSKDEFEVTLKLNDPSTCVHCTCCIKHQNHTLMRKDYFKVRKIPNCQSAACTGCCTAVKVESLDVKVTTAENKSCLLTTSTAGPRSVI